MICYEVTLNGQRLYTAGMDGADQFEARLDKLPGTTTIVLSVTAFAPTREQPAGFVEWKTAELEVGDSVTLRIVDAEQADPPMTAEQRQEAAGHENGEGLTCSFCGKSQQDVQRLVAGPSVFICDECIELCADIVAREKRGQRGDA